MAGISIGVDKAERREKEAYQVNNCLSGNGSGRRRLFYFFAAIRAEIETFLDRLSAALTS